jgi:hypothetical protein
MVGIPDELHVGRAYEFCVVIGSGLRPETDYSCALGVEVDTGVLAQFSVSGNAVGRCRCM